MNKKVILITGASFGIGHASAMALFNEGHIVYGAARRVHLIDDLVAAGGHAIEMDVTDDAVVQAGVDRIISEQGRIDGLLANAGYCLLGAVENLPIEEVTKQFDTNVVGVGRAIQAVPPHIREAVERPEIAGAEPVRIDLFKHFGYFVTESSGHASEYVPYFRKSPEIVESHLVPRFTTPGNEWFNNGRTGGYLHKQRAYTEHASEEFEALASGEVDPLTAAVCTLPQIHQMVAEMLEAQAEWLPQFSNKVDTYCVP